VLECDAALQAAPARGSVVLHVAARWSARRVAHTGDGVGVLDQHLTFQAIRIEVNGSLAAGPGQLGDYYVRVPAKQIAAVTEKLRTSNIVDAVAVVDGLPPRER